MTTTDTFLKALIRIVSDLPKEMTTKSRYENLLESMSAIFPIDALVLLKLKGEVLRPIAMFGLNDDAMGRRFNVEEHPRLKLALQSNEIVRFPESSDLPDPYDGLLTEYNYHQHVHDCMAVSLFIDNKLWGLLTFDSLTTGCFDSIDSEQLNTFIRLTEAAIKADERIKALQATNARHRLVSQTITIENTAEIISSSEVMDLLKDEILIVAQSHLTVLVLGETGVGKELVARQVHALSPRAKGPLIYVNCAALPENIAESELFGHKKGAFTGATSDRAGKFEIADGGTLFLDEVGELSLSVQAKLLRALQSGEIQRVGSDRNIQMDVRIVAATNRDLQKEVKENRFRSDLFHRLSVYPVTVPPLRDRGQDILLIAEFLLEQNQRRLGIEALRLTENAKKLLLSYPWPGNVRELEHTLSRAALKSISGKNNVERSGFIHDYHLDITPDNTYNRDSQLLAGQATNDGQENTHILQHDFSGSLKDAIDDFQRHYIISMLTQNHGNQAATARDLGVNRSNFYRLLKRLNVDSNES